MVDANLARRSVQHSRAACRSIIWEIWALSVDDREVDSVVVDEGETDELASEVRIGLSAGGRWIRTSGSAREEIKKFRYPVGVQLILFMGPSPGSQPSHPVATPASNTAPINAR